MVTYPKISNFPLVGLFQTSLVSQGNLGDGLQVPVDNEAVPRYENDKVCVMAAEWQQRILAIS
jgi:hypothetical protein